MPSVSGPDWPKTHRADWPISVVLIGQNHGSHQSPLMELNNTIHNFQPISSQHCQRHRGTSDENKQSEWGKDTNSYFPCAFRVYGESYVCAAGVRCGRWYLGMTSVQFPSYYRASQVGATREEFPECMEIFHTLGELSPSDHMCCGVSPCGQELGEITWNLDVCFLQVAP